MEQKNTHYNYLKCVKKDRTWTVGKLSSYEHYIIKKYWSRNNKLVIPTPSLG
jgi:hypothetical protein